MPEVQEQFKEWSVVVLTFLQSMLQKLGQFLPSLIGALLLIILGIFVAKVIRKVTVKLLNLVGIASLGEKVKFNDFLAKIGLGKKLEEIIAAIAYYTVLLIFLVSAAEVLGVTVVLETLNRFIAYLPHILGAFVILVITFFVAKFIKDTTSSAMANLNFAGATLLSSALEVLIIAFGLLIALNELGFDMTVFTANITILVAGAVFMVVLSVGLGSRHIVGNILAKYYISQLYNIEDEVTLTGIKGKIVRITPVSVVIKNEKGEDVYIPNEKIIREGSTVAA